MASSIVHVGRDDCARLLVLKTAGYDILDCGLSTRRLQKSLQLPYEAIVVSESVGLVQSKALSLVGSQSAPVILFESVERILEPSGFDLVVPSLTSPEIWLERIEALLAKSKTLHKESQATRATSVELRATSNSLREQSRAERNRTEKLKEDLGS